MKFKIRLVTTPGDAEVSRAAIVKVDKLGVEDPQQMVLEGETVECEVTLSKGEKLILKELERPATYHPDHQWTIVPLDLTPADPLKKPPPPTTPSPKEAIQKELAKSEPAHASKK